MKTDIRPWGHFKIFTENEKTTVKIIYVNKNEELSYQSHKNRDEMWYLIDGKAIVNLDGGLYPFRIKEQIHIKKGMKHNIKALTNVIFLEIAYGDFDEDDIIRYEDKYGRETKSWFSISFAKV